ncbi:MAG: hypothetical protein ACI9QL_000592 [Candidatus Omnitrophota bacterium]|jgi:hypothetical protein
MLAPPFRLILALLFIGLSANAAMLIKVEYLTEGEAVLETYYTARDRSAAADLLQLIKMLPEMAGDEADVVVPDTGMPLQATLSNVVVRIKHTSRVYAEISTNVLTLIRATPEEGRWHVSEASYQSLAVAAGLQVEGAKVNMISMVGVAAVLIPVLLLIRMNRSDAA